MGVSNRPRNHPHDEGSGDGWLRLGAEGRPVIVKVPKPDCTLRYASPASGGVLDHAHPDDLPRVISGIEKIVSSVNGDTIVVGYRLRHRNSAWRCMEGTGLKGPGGGGSS